VLIFRGPGAEKRRGRQVNASPSFDVVGAVRKKKKEKRWLKVNRGKKKGIETKTDEE